MRARNAVVSFAAHSGVPGGRHWRAAHLALVLLDEELVQRAPWQRERVRRQHSLFPGSGGQKKNRKACQWPWWRREERVSERKVPEQAAEHAEENVLRGVVELGLHCQPPRPLHEAHVLLHGKVELVQR